MVIMHPVSKHIRHGGVVVCLYSLHSVCFYVVNDYSGGLTLC